jgi:hypothetical protein
MMMYAAKVWNFCHLIFGFVSNFEIRISNLLDILSQRENIVLLFSSKFEEFFYQLRLHDVAFDFKFARGVGLHGRQFAVHQI